jgi:amino acid transporter
VINEGEPAASGEGTPLNRAISKPLLVVFVTGDILGAGIYAVAGKIAGAAGGALWAPMLLAFALAMLTAMSYAELVTKYPQAAGAALYIHKAFGLPFLTFIIAVAVMASGISSASTSALAFAGYLGGLIELPQTWAALLFLLVLSIVNFRGISESIKLNLGLTIIEASGLVIVIVIGVLALAGGHGDVSRVVEFKADVGILMAILSGAALAFFSFVGFEDSVNVAEETKDPRRVFPFALFTGLGIALVFYLLVVLTASIVLPTDQLAASSAPLLAVVEIGAPAFPAWFFALIALLAVTNTALINLIMASRLLYGLSEQGIVPALFGRVHARRRTPWIAIIVVTGIAVALVSTGTIGALAGTTVVLLLSVFTLVNVSVLVLRKQRLDAQHFRAPSIVPVLGAASSAGLAVFAVVNDPMTALRACVLIAIGAALWFVNLAFQGQRQPLAPERLE